MQIKSFVIPILAPETQEEEINKFLRSHRVTTVDRQFSSDNGGYWSLLVAYQEGATTNGQGNAPSRSNKVDYREVLSPDEFGRFAHYRDIRKEIATNEGIPAYAVFTDSELAQMAQIERLSVTSIANIKGVGKRAEKYGEAFIHADFSNEEDVV